jgi:hypothetical protein
LCAPRMIVRKVGSAMRNRFSKVRTNAAKIAQNAQQKVKDAQSSKKGAHKRATDLNSAEAIVAKLPVEVQKRVSNRVTQVVNEELTSYDVNQNQV